jgi:hypothetical protein
VVEKEVIKVKLPKPLAERFRRYVAEKYGLRKGALPVAVADLIGKALGTSTVEGVDAIVGLGLESGYTWAGEDLAEALMGAGSRSVLQAE